MRVDPEPLIFRGNLFIGDAMRSLFAVALLALAACDTRTLVVESDSAWDGGIFGPTGSRWVEGSGDARYPLGEGRHCWAFNAAPGGEVRVYVESPTITGSSAQSETGTAVDGCTG